MSDERDTENPTPHRSGFVTFVGRPNVGKSTLTNALVGEKIAITSEKPQTTRRAIRGIVNRPDGQLVIVDTPGIHRPRTLLGERLNDLVGQVLGDVDVIGFCVPATEKVGPGDKRIAASLDGYPRAKKVAIVTKVDIAERDEITERLMEVDSLREDWAAVIPLSALTRVQLDVLADEVLSLMPEGPSLYEAIIIGRKGARLRDVGATARAGIEELLGTRVFLGLHVKVAKEWQRDPKQLGRLGF